MTTAPDAPPRTHPLQRRPWPWLLPLVTGGVGVLLGVLVALLGTVLLSPAASGQSATTAEAVRDCGLGDRDSVSFRPGDQDPELRLSWAAAEDTGGARLDLAPGDARCVLDRLGATPAETHRLLDTDRASAAQVLENYQVTSHLDDAEHQYMDFQPTH